MIALWINLFDTTRDRAGARALTFADNYLEQVFAQPFDA